MSNTVTAAELGRLFDVDEQTIRRLARERIIIREGHGRYAVGASIKGYVIHLRAEARKRVGDNPDIDPVYETAALARSKRQHFDLLNKRLEGKAVPIDAIPGAWGRIVDVVQDMAAKILARVKLQLPHLSDSDMRTVEQTIRQQLDDAGLDEMPAVH